MLRDYMWVRWEFTSGGLGGLCGRPGSEPRLVSCKANSHLFVLISFNPWICKWGYQPWRNQRVFCIGLRIQSTILWPWAVWKEWMSPQPTDYSVGSRVRCIPCMRHFTIQSRASQKAFINLPGLRSSMWDPNKQQKNVSLETNFTTMTE